MKIIDEFWSEEHNQYCLTIATKFGNFTGIATCSPEDVAKGLATKWDGMDIAFYKAIMAYTKAKTAAYRQRAIGAKEAYYAFYTQYLQTLDSKDKINWYDTKEERSAYLDGESDALQFLQWQYTVLFLRYKEEKEKYENLKNNFNDYVDSLQTQRKNAQLAFETFLNDIKNQIV